MKKRITTLTFVTLGSVAIVIILFSAVPRVPMQNNGFTRKLVATDIPNDASLDMGFNSFYFGGSQNGKILLGNETSPLFVLSCNQGLRDTVQRFIDKISNEKGRNCMFVTKKDKFYLWDRISSVVHSGNLADFQVTSTEPIKSATDLISPLSGHSYLLRCLTPPPFRYHLGKQLNGKVYRDTTLLEKGDNALFTSDGLLTSNDRQTLFVYSYFYRNSFLALDSNLRLVHKGQTIDTNFTAKIQLSSLQGGKSITLRGKPRTVNVATCLYDSLLLIYSRLKADNQPESSLRKVSNIDVYNAVNGSYLGSFTLSRYKGADISGLRIYDNYLYVIADRYLLRYPLHSIKILQSGLN
jgi:hypothetical protein